MLLPTVIRKSSAFCVRPIPVASPNSAVVTAILRICPATALSNTRMEVIVVSFCCMGLALSVAPRDHFHGLLVPADDHDLIRRRRRDRDGDGRRDHDHGPASWSGTCL